MYFLIGLGIIVIIVYGNMLYDRIKTNKNKDTTDVEKSAGTADNHFAEQKETKGQKTEINRQAPDQDQSGSMVKTVANIAFSGPTLTQMIVDDLKQAVTRAQQICRKHHTVLLSPAASSYDHFKNFEERGEVFTRLAMECQE